MNFNNICLLNLLLFSLTAKAFPHASLNQLTHPVESNCSQNGSWNNGLRDLIQQVNIVAQKGPDGKLFDPRGTGPQKARQLGMSKDEISRLDTVGDIVCPGRPNEKGEYNGLHGTAIIVGDGLQILTNAHIFVDKDGNNREPLVECFFANKVEPFDMIPLEVNMNKMKLFTREIKNEPYLDLALVRLKRKAKGDIRPFKLGMGNLPIRKTDELIMVSASQRHMPPNTSTQQKSIRLSGYTLPFERHTELIIQRCLGQEIVDAHDEVSTTAVYSDCAGTPGASGSPLLVRSTSGELVIGLIHAAGGPESSNFQPFTMEIIAPRSISYSRSIQINRDIAAQVDQFQAEFDKKRSAATDSSVLKTISNSQGI